MPRWFDVNPEGPVTSDDLMRFDAIAEDYLAVEVPRLVGIPEGIEAGIVLCQYWAERKRQLLVICPASLRKQWALD